MTRLGDGGTAAQWYDGALKNARDRRLPPGYPSPRPCAAWPPENVALLERYRDWLLEGGASPLVVRHLYVPMAGYALGYALTHWEDLDIERDLAPALAYVEAKGTSTEWQSMSRCALDKFRAFLRQARGLATVALPPEADETYPPDLPAWLGEPLLRWLHLCKRNWRPARCRELAHNFWDRHARLWRWLLAHYPTIAGFSDVTRAQVLAYADARLGQGVAVSTINRDLLSLRGFLFFLQEQGAPVPANLLQLKPLKAPDRLPRFLTDAQVRALQQDLEDRIVAAGGIGPAHRDACLDRASFYLMWHGGLRLGEVEELRLEDLDLAGHRLAVREGKGLLDRTVYLTEVAVSALQAYLDVRGPGPTTHVILYRNQLVHKDLLHSRIREAGLHCGVAVSPHRLRHTYATQLLNAGCSVTSIQRLLGHRRLNSTMVYARVHDQTVAQDYHRAMQRVELLSNDEAASPAPIPTVVGTPHPAQLTDVVAQLAKPKLALASRLALVDQLCSLLDLPTIMTGPVSTGRPPTGSQQQPASPRPIARVCHLLSASDSRLGRAPP